MNDAQPVKTNRLTRRLTKVDAEEAARGETLASVRDCRANFEDAVRRALAAGAKPALEAAMVIEDFERIEAEVALAPMSELETLEDKAERLERLRAYVYPPEEIVIEGKSAFSDLSQWGIPSPVLATLQQDVMPLLSDKNPNLARGALRSLYAAYDYWAWYVDWHAAYMERMAWFLIAFEIAFLAFTIWRFVSGDVILGCIGAGVCGALVSVISKMPPLMADAESDAYLRRILMRVGTGIAAAIIGTGFLASGVVTITIPTSKVTMTEMLEQCGKDVRAAEAQPGPRCGTSALLLLLALGVVLGFSERALTSFEERVFPVPPAPGASARPREPGNPSS